MPKANEEEISVGKKRFVLDRRNRVIRWPGMFGWRSCSVEDAERVEVVAVSVAEGKPPVGQVLHFVTEDKDWDIGNDEDALVVKMAAERISSFAFGTEKVVT